MASLFDPLLNATQSDIITLIVGENDKQIKINAPKDVLSIKSETMAKLIEKAGGKLSRLLQLIYPHVTDIRR